MKSNKNQIQLSLFESEKTKDKLIPVIYQKDTIININEIRKIPIKKKIKENNNINDLPF